MTVLKGRLKVLAKQWNGFEGKPSTDELRRQMEEVWKEIQQIVSLHPSFKKVQLKTYSF